MSIQEKNDLDRAFDNFFDDLKNFMKNVDEENNTDFQVSKVISRPKRIQSNPMHRDNNWNDQDDKILYSVTIEYKNDWKKIIRRIKTLCNKKMPLFFLKERYNVLRGEAKIVRFNALEDKALLEAVKIAGSKWSEIAKSFPGRDQNCLRNRYYYLMKKVPTR